ncbi:hypothetical protein GJ496_007446 [Pomphorhynchus laevis]|nr:hypothetical protein GJ496_007446 [Pomphorhynchus laevis]
MSKPFTLQVAKHRQLFNEILTDLNWTEEHIFSGTKYPKNDELAISCHFDKKQAEFESIIGRKTVPIELLRASDMPIKFTPDERLRLYRHTVVNNPTKDVYSYNIDDVTSETLETRCCRRPSIRELMVEQRRRRKSYKGCSKLCAVSHKEQIRELIRIHTEWGIAKKYKNNSND